MRFPRPVVTTSEGLKQLSAILADHDLICFDCETTSPDGDGLAFDRFMFGYSVAVKIDGEWRGWYIPVRHDNVRDLFYTPPKNAPLDKALDLIRGLQGKTLIIHNLSFEYKVFINEGIDPKLFQYEDTYAIAYLIDPTREGGNGLKALVKDIVGYQMKDFTFARAGVQDGRFAPLGTMAPYAIDDVVQMGRLYDKLWPVLEKRSLVKVYRDLYLEIIPLSVEMTEHGIKIDRSRLEQLEKDWYAELGQISDWFNSVFKTECNLASPKWLSDSLVDTGILPPLRGMERGASGQWSTASKIVQRWADGENNTPPKGVDCAKKLLRNRSLSKLISAYTETLIKAADSRLFVHPSFKPMGTSTGRWSCNNPNLQTVPSRTEEGKKIRACFIADQDDDMVLVGADFSQIEYRLLAHFSQAPALVESYINGEDLHRRTAAIVYGIDIDKVTDKQRSSAKGVNFGIIYGQGPAALAETIGTDEAGAKKFLKRYFDKIDGVKPWMEGYIERSRSLGYTTTLLGRRRYLPDLKSPITGFRAAAERRVINTRIQGSAADLTNIALRNLQRAINEGLPASIQLMVHDEIIVSCKRADAADVAAAMERIMGSVVQLRVPLIAEAQVGLDMKEIK